MPSSLTNQVCSSTTSPNNSPSCCALSQISATSPLSHPQSTSCSHHQHLPLSSCLPVCPIEKGGKTADYESEKVLCNSSHSEYKPQASCLQSRTVPLCPNIPVHSTRILAPSSSSSSSVFGLRLIPPYSRAVIVLPSFHTALLLIHNYNL